MARVRLGALALALAAAAGCARAGDGGCNDAAVAGARPGIRYLRICGHVLEIDDARDRMRYLGARGDAALGAEAAAAGEDLQDLASGELSEPRPLAWDDLRVAASARGVQVLAAAGASPPAAVPAGGSGLSLGTVLPGALAIGAGVRFCAAAEQQGPVDVEVWQVRYRNPGGTSRLRAPLGGLARCPSRAAPAAAEPQLKPP